MIAVNFTHRCHQRASMTSLGLLLLVAGLLCSGCSTDNRSLNHHHHLADTSIFAVEDITYWAYNDHGSINSGLALQWFESFKSNYHKNCLIKRYVILAPHGDTLFDASTGSHAIGDGIILNGKRHYARTKELDIADSAVTGLYGLHIFYRHSQTDFHWDSTISIEANQFVDTTGSGK